MTQVAPQPAPPAPSRYFWTTHEVRTLQEHYVQRGPRYCAKHLPGRTLTAIRGKAEDLGLRHEIARGTCRERIQSNDWIDAQIRQLYLDPPRRRGAVAELAARIDRPADWIGRRAVKLGLARPRFRDPQWTEQELELLEEHAHKGPHTVANILRRHGYQRSASAIDLRRKRLGIRLADDPDRFSPHQVALAMGVDHHKVRRWISAGLKAKPRGTARTAAQNGDEWLIKRRDLRAFLISHLGDWDHRRCEQLWLVELLAGTVGGEL
jgi:hypothetical protein